MLRLHGVVQVDSRTFFKTTAINGNDGFLAAPRAADFSGTVFRDFDFNFTPDFGGSTVQIFDAYRELPLQPVAAIASGQIQIARRPGTVAGGSRYTRSTNARWSPIWCRTAMSAWNCTGDLFDGGVLSYAAGHFQRRDGLQRHHGNAAFRR